MKLKRRVKVRLLIGAVLFVPIAIVAWWGIDAFLSKEALVTFDQLRERTADLKQSKAYKDGGGYVARLEQAGVTYRPSVLDDNPSQHMAIVTYELANFAGSIAPMNIEIMKKKGELPFTSLSPYQQQLLLHLAWYANYGWDNRDIQNSTFLFLRQRKGRIRMIWNLKVKYGSRIDHCSFGLSSSRYRDSKYEETKGIQASSVVPSKDVVSAICNGSLR